MCPQPGSASPKESGTTDESDGTSSEGDAGGAIDAGSSSLTAVESWLSDARAAQHRARHSASWHTSL